MTHQFKKLLLVIPLVLIAGVVAAYTPQTSTPPGNNSNAPINIGDSDQVKAGGLSVTTFQSREGSVLGTAVDPKSNVLFNGLIRGGTSSNRDSAVTFGTSTYLTSALVNGTVATDGSLISASLKSGGGVKPVCSDTAGKYVLCGSSSSSQGSIMVRAARKFNENNNTAEAVRVLLTVSENTGYRISGFITVYYAAEGTTPPAGVSFLKNYFTANAKVEGSGDTCPYNAIGTSLGKYVIDPGSTYSSSYEIPTTCDSSRLTFKASQVTPTSIEGRPVVAG